MSRTDSNLLEVNFDAQSASENLLEEVRAARSEIEIIEAKADAEIVLDHCPSCDAKLSSLDHKFGSCTSCGKPIAPLNSDMTVRI